MLLKFSVVFVLLSLSLYSSGNVISTKDSPKMILSTQVRQELIALVQNTTFSEDETLQIEKLTPIGFTLPGGSKPDLLEVLHAVFKKSCPRTGSLGRFACVFCANDCLYVHNKFGGGCGAAPNSEENGGICVCNDKRPTSGPVFSDVLGSCGGITGDVKTDLRLDLVIKTSVRELAAYQKCIPKSDNEIPKETSLGCSLDCQISHGYSTGRCVQEAPVATFPGETYPGFCCGCFK